MTRSSATLPYAVATLCPSMTSEPGSRPFPHASGQRSRRSMFDAETAALIRSAPPLRGVDPELLPQELTSIYAELAGLRLRAAQFADAPDYLAQIERLTRIAVVYEAVVDDTVDGEARRAAAFVAGTA